MRLSVLVPFFVIMLSLCLGAGPRAHAEVSIGVVDVQRLLTESNAAHHIQVQIEQAKATFLEGLSSQEHELRELEKKLSEERNSLSKEDFAKKKTVFETRFMEARRLAQKQKHGIDMAADKAMAKLRDKIYVVVGEIASEKGYTLVLSNQDVIVGDKSLNISDEAMKRLNESISEITLEIDDN